MPEINTPPWLAANHRYLLQNLARMRQALERHAQQPQPDPTLGDDLAMTDDPALAADVCAELPSAGDTAMALQTLCAVFKLSTFERDLLLLCAGVELEADFAPLCAAAQGDAQRNYVTFALALALLPQAHWSALTPAAPLRHWHLLEVEAHRTLAHSPLHIDERVLHYLVGVNELDARLHSLLRPLSPPDLLVPSQQTLTTTITNTWLRAAEAGRIPAIQLCGPEVEDKRGIAAAACANVGLKLYRMPVSVIPNNPTEADHLLRLWEREAALSKSALLLDADVQSMGEVGRGEVGRGEAGMEHGVSRFLASDFGPILVSSRDRRSFAEEPLITFEVAKPTPAEQMKIWRAELGKVATHYRLSRQLDHLASHYNFNRAAIRAIATTAKGQLPVTAAKAAPLKATAKAGALLWELCRTQARPRLDELAQRIEPIATWDDLILPSQQRTILEEIIVQVHQRRQVYEKWQFAEKGKRGLGISVLLAGASGTGKTLAAEVLARTLRFDLYRIDLSAVVSKYIGETEKNLRQIFDAAESGGVLLLFDEADALFGKRSQVTDSHDRHANIEVSYLLQRMEAYHGLAILTTNMKDALDSAFLRRLRFVVQFPFPDVSQRAEIWQHIYPAKLQTEGLDWGKLARLNIAGGNIRNIALNAAFMAAGAGEPVRMNHLLRATHREYAKLERTLTDTEVRGWTEA